MRELLDAAARAVRDRRDARARPGLLHAHRLRVHERRARRAERRRRRRALRRPRAGARRRRRRPAWAGRPASSGSCSPPRSARCPSRSSTSTSRSPSRSRSCAARRSAIAAEARRAGVPAQLELAGRSLKGQLKQAGRIGARYVAIVSSEGIELKDMESGEQEDVGVRERRRRDRAARKAPRMNAPRANALPRHAGAARSTRATPAARSRVAGWVHRRRDHGGLIFIDLRDRSGIVQLVFHPDTSGEAFALAERLRSEHVVSAAGSVALREAGNVNPNLADRRDRAQRHVARRARRERHAAVPDRRGHARSTRRCACATAGWTCAARGCSTRCSTRTKVVRTMREVLDARDFLEVETPILTKSTPEGARDFLVPSRFNAGVLVRAAAEPAALQAAADDGRASSATTRSRAASATRTCAPTASRSSRSWTSRWRSSPRTT